MNLPSNDSANKQSKRITLMDVAQYVGVSKSTVSLVLQNDSAVSEKTREKVLLGIKETGYVYNRRAASLRQSNHHDSFAILLHSLRTPFTSELLDEFEKISLAQDFMPLYASNVDIIERQEQLVQLYLEHGVSGLILCPASQTSASWLQQLWRRGLPTIQILRQVPFSSIPSVTAENRKGTYDAVSHLISNGHQKIGFVGGNVHDSDFQERYQGYQDAHNDAGLFIDDSLCVPCSQSVEAGGHAFDTIYARDSRTTATFCFTDFNAYGVANACQTKGLKVGDDIAIIGFDDISFSQLSFPQMSSVRADNEKMANAAIDLLKLAIKGELPENPHIKIPTELIIRASSSGFRSTPSVTKANA